MTLTTTSGRNDATGNDAVNTYPYSYKIFLKTDLKVTIKDLLNQQTTLTVDTDYTVSNVGSVNGGSITLVNSGQSWLTAGGFLKNGYKITVRRVPVKNQTTDIRNQGAYFPETIEDTLDKLVMITQQMQDEVDRSIKASETDYTTALTLPNSSTRANGFLSFDGSGNPSVASGISSVPVSSFMTSVVASIDAPTARTALGAGVDPATTMTTIGDLLIKNASNILARLGVGTSSQVLGVSGGVPAWVPSSVNAGVTASKTSTGSIAAADDFVPVDPTGGSFALSLPTGLAVGKRLVVKDVRSSNSNFNVVTLNRSGSDTIDDGVSTSTTINTKGETLVLVYDGASKWYVVSRDYPRGSTSFTPTFTSFGTATGVSFSWARRGDSIRIIGQFTSGTVTGSEARISLPGSLTASSSLPTPAAGNGIVVGVCLQPVGGGFNLYTLTEPGVGYMTFGIQDNSRDAMVKQPATGILANSAQAQVYADIPIAGWN